MQSVIISSGVLVTTIIAFARVPTLWVLLLGRGQLPGLPNDPAGRWWSWWWCGITPVILLQEHFYTIHHITIIILGTIGLSFFVVVCGGCHRSGRLWSWRFSRIRSWQRACQCGERLCHAQVFICLTMFRTCSGHAVDANRNLPCMSHVDRVRLHYAQSTEVCHP